jgi:ribokinase
LRGKTAFAASLNPAPAQPIDIKAVADLDYFVPNESEAEAISGMPVRNLDDARRCASKLLAGGIRRVIITLGANGSLLAGSDGMEHVPAFSVKSVDSTGAGDAFIGSFATFLGEGSAGAGSRQARQSLRGTLDDWSGNAEVFL